MMRKKTTFGFALTCVLLAAVIAFAAGFGIASIKVKNVTDPSGGGSSGYQMLDEVKKIVSENYLGDIDEKNLVTGICKGYVEGVGDKSLRYLTADEYAAYNKETSGETVIYKNFGKGVGYVQFLGFSDSTKQSFSNALNDFSKSATSRVNMLVLDIRNCSSNNIEAVASLLDVLLPEGETVAGIDKNGARTVLYTSDQSALDYDIAVLVNGNTSGTAEIFASTLSAYNKAVIVGTTTAGDCTKTDAKQLSNGDYVLIPSMYYVTKGQQTYSNAGVVPTNIVELSAADQKAFDSATLDIAKDPQFVAALKALGINDIPTSSDVDGRSSDSDIARDSDSDSDRDSDASSNGNDTDSSDNTSDEDYDPYWDDDEYWNSSNSGDSSSDENNDDEYYEDDYYYDDYDYYYEEY